MGELMKLIDNINSTVIDDLQSSIQKGDKILIASAYFSIYAYQALKEKLESVDELRFVFTSPTFFSEKSAKASREFYIPQLNRERSLYGSSFELKLKNELNQKAIARECAEWIKNKVTFRTNITEGNIAPFCAIGKDERSSIAYSPFNSFSTPDLGLTSSNNIMSFVNRIDSPQANDYIKMFNQIWDNKDILKDVTEEVIDNISAAYKENSPEFIYYVAIFNIFKEFLSDISEDVLPNEATGFKSTKIWSKLFDFQKDAVLAIINKLERFNGCILADSVGLGKTFSALAVIKYYELRNRNVLVLCPKKLSDNWATFKENYLNNPIAEDRLRYDVLYHTDLSRESGFSGSIDLSRINWSNYDLVVIDESHNFRNGGDYSGQGENRKENRYLKLLNKVIRQGIKTKVLMLSATPVNNGFSDLRHQLELAYEGDQSLINDKLDTEKPIDVIFRNAQTAFNRWSKLAPASRTTEHLLKSIDFDFFILLDSVTIARSRRHIEKYYDIASIGRFPTRKQPIALRPKLSDLSSAIDYDEIYDILMQLNLSIYTPTDFLLPSKRDKYIDPEVNIDRAGRESGIRRLMTINLLKRLESSVYSFNITVSRVKELISKTIDTINEHETKQRNHRLEAFEMNEIDFDGDDLNTEYFGPSLKKLDIDLDDMDFVSWRELLHKDMDELELLLSMINDITPKHDTKLQTLISLIKDKVEHPINPNNKKILIFSAFSDTVEYLYSNISYLLKKEYSIDTAMVTGTTNGKSTVKLNRTDINTLLTLFSPLSKDKAILMPNSKDEVDILIATDCISEGQNLQDCDYCVNYDIHWNPVRIIQRFGRIDRIGSQNESIQLVNFWPNIGLDKYLELKGRVETRMKASVMTSTGDDNPIDPEELGDLEYRKTQLEKLQNEVVDIEDMQNGVSIMDLGLNEFRLDLLDYVKTHDNLDQVPYGLHAVVKGYDDTPKGTLFVLKNKNDKINHHQRNQLHPFYMVYIQNDSSVHIDHLQPKKLLDIFRKLCKGNSEPLLSLCRDFNQETKDGKNMQKYSQLLQDAVSSIVDINEELSISSFIKGEQFSLDLGDIEGVNDFELICFINIR